MAEQVSKLNSTQLDKIIAAFKSNSQLHSSIYLSNKNRRLLSFLKKTTGRDFIIDGKTIKEIGREDHLEF
jgi:hypothetical protein